VLDFWKQPDIVENECTRLRHEGCLLFQEHRVEEACVAFDKAAKECPRCRPFLWQHGIARYYAGDFQGAADQFAAGQAVNSDDTEEVIWEMLSRASLARATATAIAATTAIATATIASTATIAATATTATATTIAATATT
ncbi:unnamed protein product, partial [Polarella glacialis]